jgi:hypothetical protein
MVTGDYGTGWAPAGIIRCLEVQHLGAYAIHVNIPSQAPPGTGAPKSPRP